MNINHFVIRFQIVQTTIPKALMIEQEWQKLFTSRKIIAGSKLCE